MQHLRVHGPPRIYVPGLLHYGERSKKKALKELYNKLVESGKYIITIGTFAFTE